MSQASNLLSNGKLDYSCCRNKRGKQTSFMTFGSVRKRGLEGDGNWNVLWEFGELSFRIFAYVEFQ